jgi:hypothetical protein
MVMIKDIAMKWSVKSVSGTEITRGAEPIPQASRYLRHYAPVCISGCLCLFAALAAGTEAGPGPADPPFEGRIQATVVRGDESLPLLYTIGTDTIRLEVTAHNRPHPINLVDRSSGEWILVFPHNRSFVRLKPEAWTAPAVSPSLPPIPLPPDLPGPGMMPMPVPVEKLELTATGQKTKLLGFDCERFELKRHGEILEIWATDELFRFPDYRRNQPHRFGPRMIEETWAELIRQRKLFPLLASLRFESGPERYRFEVQAVRRETIADPEGRLFKPPTGYHETDPLPF